MTLTSRGWAVGGAAAAVGVLWYLFGEVELGVAAGVLTASLFWAAVLVGASRPRVGVSRRLNSRAVHEGDNASVVLFLVNRGRVLRHVTVSDEVEGLGVAGFAGAALPPGAEVTASYRVLCRPRGVYPVGPAEVGISDPFRLASRRVHVGPTDSLVVYPAVEDLRGFPGIPGRHLAVNASRPEHHQHGGEDFYTLREFADGDDLRRVHWPSSAHLDHLMIRQLETPWQARALVFLDVRPEVYPDAASFETAVSGAASVVRHLHRNGFTARLWTGSGNVHGDGYPAAMERLARVTTQDRVDLLAVASSLRRSPSGGMLVLVTGRPDHALLGTARILASDHRSIVLMSAVTGAPDEVVMFQRGGIVTVDPAIDGSWAPSWSNAVGGKWHIA